MRGQTDSTVAVVGILATFFSALLAAGTTAWFTTRRQRDQQLHEEELKGLELAHSRGLKDVEELRATLDQGLASARKARDAAEDYVPGDADQLKRIKKRAADVTLLVSRLVLRLGAQHAVTKKYEAVVDQLEALLDFVYDLQGGPLTLELQERRDGLATALLEAEQEYALEARKLVGSYVGAESAASDRLGADSSAATSVDVGAGARSLTSDNAGIYLTVATGTALLAALGIVLLQSSAAPCGAGCERPIATLTGAILVAIVGASAAWTRGGRGLRPTGGPLFSMLALGALGTAVLLIAWAMIDWWRGELVDDGLRILAVVLFAGLSSAIATALAATAVTARRADGAALSAGETAALMVGDYLAAVGAVLATTLLIFEAEPGDSVLAVLYATIALSVGALAFALWDAERGSDRATTRAGIVVLHAAVALPTATATALLLLL